MEHVGKKKAPAILDRAGVKRQLALAACALLAALAVWVVNWARTPEALSLETMPEDGRSVLAGLEWESHDCRVQRGWVLPTGSRPRAYFSGFEGQVQSVAVRLERELPTGTLCRLYYPDSSGSYRKTWFDEEVASGGKRELLFSLPAEEYSSLRLEIPQGYRLEDVRVSAQPLVAESHAIPAFRFFDLALFFLLLLALGELALYRRKAIAGLLKSLWRGKKAYGWALLKMLGVGTICGLLAWPVCNFRGIAYQWQQAAFFVAGGVGLCGLWFMRRWAAEYPQRIFAFLCLGTGLLFILASPLTSYLTGEGGFPFQNALSLSYAGNVHVTGAEKALMNQENFPLYFDMEQNRLYAESLRTAFDSGTLYVFWENVFQPAFLGYLPGALGLWLGRFLGLSFTSMYVLGRFSSLLAYTLVVSCAVKRADRGKALLCAVALTPTAVFQAASYNGNSWTMAFAMLGAALYFSELRRAAPITPGRAGAILGVFLLAFLPRPAYFPLLLMLFFLPGAKLPNPGARRRWRLSVLFEGLLLAVLFLLPLATGQTSAGGPRGGLPVTALSQAKHIVTDPVDYAKVLVKFLAKEYLNPSHAGRVLTELGSFSGVAVHVPGAVLVLALLLFVSITEPEAPALAGPERLIPWEKAGVMAGVCCAIGLVATWSYLAFSPVSASTISGCGGLSLLPLLFPGLSVFRSAKIQCSFRKDRYLYAVLCPLAALTCLGIWLVLRCYT